MTIIIIINKKVIMFIYIYNHKEFIVTAINILLLFQKELIIVVVEVLSIC